ncbi:MAG: hypothetical protein Kow0063_24220 [Anaerolineae bacterium]
MQVHKVRGAPRYLFYVLSGFVYNLISNRGRLRPARLKFVDKTRGVLAAFVQQTGVSPKPRNQAACRRPALEA